jgi:hypothetical protein
MRLPTGRPPPARQPAADMLLLLLLTVATAQQQVSSLLHESYRFDVLANTAAVGGSATRAGLSVAVAVAEMPPLLLAAEDDGDGATPAATGAAMHAHAHSWELVLSDAYSVTVHGAGGARGRVRLPDSSQLAFARPFFVLVGADGASEVIGGARGGRGTQSGGCPPPPRSRLRASRRRRARGVAAGVAS